MSNITYIMGVNIEQILLVTSYIILANKSRDSAISINHLKVPRGKNDNSVFSDGDYKNPQ